MHIYTLHKNMQMIWHETINPNIKKLLLSCLIKNFNNLFYKMIIFYKEIFLSICANGNEITITSAIVKILEMGLGFVFSHVYKFM